MKQALVLVGISKRRRVRLGLKPRRRLHTTSSPMCRIMRLRTLAIAAVLAIPLNSYACENWNDLPSFWGDMISNGNDSLLRTCLERGYDPNAQNKAGATHLHYSIWKLLYVEGVRLLLKHNANPNIATKSGETPLLLAVKRAIKFKDPKDELTVIKMLLNEGADPNFQQDGSSALHTAVNAFLILKSPRPQKSSMMLEIIDLILDHGGDPNLQDSNGSSPLALAVGIGDSQVAKKLVSILLNRKADPFLKDNNGDFPLEIAVVKEGIREWQEARRIVAQGNFRDGSLLEVFVEHGVGCKPLLIGFGGLTDRNLGEGSVAALVKSVREDYRYSNITSKYFEHSPDAGEESEFNDLYNDHLIQNRFSPVVLFGHSWGGGYGLRTRCAD